ncbi:unnamed protein product (macronuclear) [Paramecium tetraurelia]|uniref:CS domain-containing protein n=1 Tax=Paramecium tetraurelia TaxID=5888 RepID=A0BLX7_PARTE|nr:uncharacterized protein GSPATT00030178001 [Paramecium tetraurelia]CAK59544.1 unnamed protein product [Paramecium tetraurelia]|eukprot:XP_001426942.1 hypothetical protein (macronuclear) [Paramecium tetraurelia strain d4-2]
MKLYIHSGNVVEIYDSIQGETIDQLQKALGSEVLLNNRTILNTSMLVNSFFNDNDDVIVQKVKPIPVQQNAQVPAQVPAQKPIHYNNITKFAFYDADEMNVRVVVELKDIAKHPLEKFQARFFEKSFEIKIHDYQNKNWTFGVARTQCKLDAANSKFTLKGDKILITLRKVKKEDNWFSIHKQKTIGGDDSD